MKSFKQFLIEYQDLTLRNDGHYDVHGLTDEHIEWIRNNPTILNSVGHTTLELPDYLPALPNALVGPASGDDPIPDNHPDVYMASRGGGRDYDSKMLRGPHRLTRMITIVTKVDPETNQLVLHTAYGGPRAQPEPNSPNLSKEQRERSEKFWSQHALLDGQE